MATIAEQVAAKHDSFTRSPLAAYAVENYLSENALFNAVDFVPIVNLVPQATFAKYSFQRTNVDASLVGFRNIGGEFPAGTTVPEVGEAALAILGGQVVVDEEFQYARTPGDKGLENFVDQEFRKKAAELLKAFNKYVISGDSTAQGAKQFDGLEKIVPSSRTHSTAISLNDYSDEKIRIAWVELYAILDAVPGANLIITTIEGVSAFRALLATRNLSLASATVATAASVVGKKAGIPAVQFEDKLVIGLPRAYFSAAELAIGEPFYVLRRDDTTGFKFVTPVNRPIVKMVLPNFMGGNSTQKAGEVSIFTAPVIEDLYACAKGYISAGNANITSINNNVPVTPSEGSTITPTEDPEPDPGD
jgi:hypothetical protein